MQSLDSSFHPKDILSCPGSSGTKVPYVLSLQLSYKCDALRSLFNETKDTTYLIALHKHNQARLALWDRILSEFNNKDIGHIISIWNFTPFEEAVESAFDLYQLTKESRYLSEIFEYAEKGKNNEYTQLLIKNGAIKIGTEQPRLFQISLVSLKKELDKKTAFIEYIQAPNKDIRDSYTIVVTAGKSTLLKLPKKGITDSLQKELLKSMERNDPLAYDLVAIQLYNLLLKPAIKAAGAGINRLIISPSGSYTEVPFDALTVRPSRERDFRKLEYVLNHYAIGYVLNAGITFGRSENQRNTGLSVFFPEIDTMAHLLFSKRQARWLKERYEGDFHFGKEATLKRFTDNIKNKSVVQISTHSIATKKENADGLLLLQDGLIHLKDLYGKQMPVDLMIISACESGSGRQEYGEGTKSFARSFLYAGAKGAISTLWCVDEKSTAELLTAFYAEIEEGKDVLQSLSDAKKAYLKNCKLSELANPFYWGGIIFTGSPDLKIQINEKSNPLWYVVTLFIPAIVLIAFYLRKHISRL
jgi:CHAT domain-containing protein